MIIHGQTLSWFLIVKKKMIQNDNYYSRSWIYRIDNSENSTKMKLMNGFQDWNNKKKKPVTKTSHSVINIYHLKKLKLNDESNSNR